MSTYEEMLEQFRKMIRFHSESCESAATLWANLMWLTGGVIGEYFAFCEGCGTVNTLEDAADCRCVQDAFHEMLEREIDDAFVYIAAEHMTNQELAELRDNF